MAYHPVLTQHFDTSDIAFTKIDKEIAALRETIRALHAFRNTFTPVYRLPPEILTRVFSFVQRIRADFYSNTPAPLEWVNVTYVSQHWRNVAVGSPTLWSHISSAYPKCAAEEFLWRSKEAPLSINILRLGSLDPDQFVTPSLFRIRELTLELTSSSWSALSYNLSSSTPLLESLSIVITDDYDAIQSASSTISDTTFAATTPRLRSLNLTGCSLDINSIISMDLTTLELCRPPQKLSATDLLTTLHNLERLTSLVLDSVLLPSTTLAPSSMKTATFPSLECLSIQGESFTQDLDILSHLSFPANTNLHFSSFTKTAGTVMSLSDFLILQNASRLQVSQPVQATVDVDLRCFNDFLRLSIYAKYAEPASQDSLLTFHLAGQWGIGNTLEMPDLPLPDTATVFSYLPLQALTTFSTDCHISIGAWTNVFGSLPKLHCISAAELGADNLLTVIVADFKTRCPVSTSRSQTDWEPIFPHLQTIELQLMSFPESLADLVATLRTRKAVGKGIQAIGIVRCWNVDEDVVDALDWCVGKIKWDGYTGSVDEDESEH